MSSDHQGGLSFLMGRERDWTQANHVAGHNLWHTALFHLESGDYDAVLDIFDKKVPLTKFSKDMCFI
jgi:hypothetical protein